ncbi:hypothetical protein [Streptomyces sp. NPDC002521]
MTTAVSYVSDGRSAVFARTDVCREAGLTLPAEARRPVLEDDVWDFTHVVGLPVQMGLSMRQFDFAAISDPRWPLVAKELVLAMLAPRHPAVAPLPRAYRTALHLLSCRARLDELERFLSWLTTREVSSLERIDAQVCEAYMADRRYVLDEHGTVIGEQSHGTRRQAAQIVVDLVSHRELFTADRVAADLRPWGGATASAVAEMPSGRTQNKTSPVADEVLQPMLGRRPLPGLLPRTARYRTGPADPGRRPALQPKGDRISQQRPRSSGRVRRSAQRVHANVHSIADAGRASHRRPAR